MIVDAVVTPLVAGVQALLGLLPTGSALALPSLAPLWSQVAQLDSIIPIAGPLMALLGVLSLAAVFILVRLGLVVWNLLYP